MALRDASTRKSCCAGVEARSRLQGGPRRGNVSGMERQAPQGDRWLDASDTDSPRRCLLRLSGNLCSHGPPLVHTRSFFHASGRFPSESVAVLPRNPHCEYFVTPEAISSADTRGTGEVPCAAVHAERRNYAPGAGSAFIYRDRYVEMVHACNTYRGKGITLLIYPFNSQGVSCLEC